MSTATVRPPLQRPRDVVLGGVSVAVAEHLGWNLPLVRIGFVVLTGFWGAGALLYAWLWAFTPLVRVPRGETPQVTRATPVAMLTRLCVFELTRYIGLSVSDCSASPA